VKPAKPFVVQVCDAVGKAHAFGGLDPMDSSGSCAVSLSNKSETYLSVEGRRLEAAGVGRHVKRSARGLAVKVGVCVHQWGLQGRTQPSARRLWRSAIYWLRRACGGIGTWV